MYVDPLVIYIDSPESHRTFRYWLHQNVSQLNWDGIVVHISPDIQFQIEVKENSDIDEDDNDNYSLVAEIYYISQRDSNDEVVLKEHKQIVQTLLTSFKSQGWKTAVASPQYTDEDFE